MQKIHEKIQDPENPIAGRFSEANLQSTEGVASLLMETDNLAAFLTRCSLLAAGREKFAYIEGKIKRRHLS